MSDKNCQYTCRGGNWVSSCENKELENCLNYIDFDLPYCMKRAGMPYSDKNDDGFDPDNDAENGDTLGSESPDKSENR